MRTATLVRAGLVHHWRTHLGVLIGAAVATATLVGALAVGDSVRATLAGRARARIGAVDAVLLGQDRLFAAALADRLGEHVAPVLFLSAVASTASGGARVHDVKVLGVDERFFALAPEPGSAAPPSPGAALLSQELARRLGEGAGSTLVLRVERPSAIPRDMALASDDQTVALRVDPAGVIGASAFDRFAIDSSQAPPANLFVPLGWLQEQLEVPGRANLVLAGRDGTAPRERIAGLESALRAAWALEDAQLELAPLDVDPSRIELTSRRVFLDEPVIAALLSAQQLDGRDLEGVFTYFVNSIESGGRSTPYSMVSARGALRGSLDGQLTPGSADGMILNRWEADDLGVAAGARVTLKYYVVDASSRLVERERTFETERIVPLEGPAADPSLMPDFPGLADADDCREWEPGTPVDLDRIRDEDEQYWDDHRGTPKAFVTLEAAREMWESRFGALTAVRADAADEEALRGALAAGLDPRSLGLFFTDLRTPAERASDSPTDFGGLFLGLSLFLIVAALILSTQLFLFGVEARASEIGLFAAIGLQRSRIRRVFLTEAAVLGVLGGLLGAPLGLLYTRGVLVGLETFWSGAVAGLAIAFHFEWGTLALGIGSAFLATLLSVFFALRRGLEISPSALLSSRQGVDASPRFARGGPTLTVVIVCLAAAAATLALVDPSSGARASGAFFGAGAAVLIAGLAALRYSLRRDRPRREAAPSLVALGFENATRRPGRSLTTAALMAIGAFLVVAVGAGRIGAIADPWERSAGTGGFAFYGRTSLPVTQDLDSAEGREFFGLSGDELEGVAFVPLRVRSGDDASCLSLARAAAPRLLGVDPSELSRRAAFPFAATEEPTDDPWRLLSDERADGAIPAIGDATSLTWQLKLGLGDTLTYTDERGRAFDVRIVGALQDTILQGDLVIAARHFEERFPTQGGFGRFLVDAPRERASEVSRLLTRALEDVGLSLEPTGDRLEAFHAVQNTYLAIFQLLGALGVLLGSVGLGTVVLRNTLERRGELALTAAIGFTRARIRWLVVSEYGLLLALGLGVGGASALLAALPEIAGSRHGGGAGAVLLLLLVLALNGLAWILFAARFVNVRAPQAALSEE